jgi:hypothetical protein
MRIYVYKDSTTLELPTEEVWLEEDYPVSSYEYSSKFEKTKEEFKRDRNFQKYLYLCKVFNGDYFRMTFERPYELGYYDVSSIEEFLVGHPDTEVTYHRKHFFLRTWMD